MWPGASLLLAFLACLRPDLADGRRAVVELGCGTGAVGLALMPRFSAGAHLVLTDGHPALMGIAAENAALNYGGAKEMKIVARRLLWGDGAEARAQLEEMLRAEELHPGVDLVLAADVIYDIESVAPLLWTAAQLLVPPGGGKGRAGRPPAAFVLSYCGRCLLLDADFDRRLEATAESVGLRLASTTHVGEHPALAASVGSAAAAARLREANARVFEFECREDGSKGKEGAT